MFLAVDVGNTHVVLGLFQDNRLTATWRIASDLRRTTDEYRLLLGQMLADAGVKPADWKGCMISSVIPRMTQKLREAMRRMPGAINPMVLTHDLDLGVTNLYQRPEDVGSDRLANAAGGVVRYGAPLIVVDFGTATTFDVISRDKAYLGGIIMPGLEMSADSLFQKTSLLPRVAIEPPATVVGRSTGDAITSGLIWGTLAAVDRLTKQVQAEIDAPGCPVVATGGFASTIGKHSRRITVVDSDLTLFGILTIWQRNQP